MASDPNEPGWKLLRIVPNTGGAGTFVDDTDWVGTAVDLPLAVSTSVRRYRSDNAAAVASVEIVVSAFDANGVWVARSTGEFDFAPVQRIPMPAAAIEEYPAGSQFTLADGEETEGASLDRPYSLRLHGECDRFSVNLSGFTTMPTADHLKVFWRDIGG